jgi:S-ribosylhomocysteine lyase
MQRIASFSVNHDTLEKGMYISRIDGDVVTYDIRMKKPNKGNYLENAAAHTFEHLFATYTRNSKWADSIVYIGPMGCLTGFYFLVRDSVLHEVAISLVRKSFEFIKNFEGDIPGTKKQECGNYLLHDLEGAKVVADDMLKVLENWNERKLKYI